MDKQSSQISEKRITEARAGGEATIRILRELGVAQEDYGSMFPAIFSHLVTIPDREPSSAQKAAKQPVVSDPLLRDSTPEASPFQSISRETGVSIDALRSVLYYDGEKFSVSAQTNLLGKSLTQQTRAIAQLITVANRFGLNKQRTGFDEIRAACEAKACYDMRNFAHKHMRNIPGFVVRGEGMNRKLSARSDGIKHFSTLVESIYEASRSNG